MNNCNATSLFTCEAFGEHITSLLKRTLAPLERALAQADMSKIETVELIGGLNRVPALNVTCKMTDIVNFAINTAWQPIYGDSSTTLKTSIPESHVPLEVQIEATPAEGGEEAKPTKKMVKREVSSISYLFPT
ncbi:hypothetical protein H4Q26_001189 [Puccinia striiformis f. sp. tritici PST-130]|nr:hypothetical protein H4Q26_001189 [Puccinia striiformis f. sp. tritici PST-130]